MIVGAAVRATCDCHKTSRDQTRRHATSRHIVRRHVTSNDRRLLVGGAFSCDDRQTCEIGFITSLVSDGGRVFFVHLPSRTHDVNKLHAHLLWEYGLTNGWDVHVSLCVGFKFKYHGQFICYRPISLSKDVN